MYVRRNIIQFMVLTMTTVNVASLTNDCNQSPSSGAFLPKATLAAHFTTFCNHTDGRQGGCSTPDQCDAYGGSSFSDKTCTPDGKQCCLFDKKGTPINKNSCFCMNAKYCTGATFSNICPNTAICCSDERNELTRCPTTQHVSFADFKKSFPSLSEQRAIAYWPFINKGLSELGTQVTCHMKSSFLAQVSHETGGLLKTEEVVNGKGYENVKSIGNVKKGDGLRFLGRGLLHLTGRWNYQKYTDVSGNDIVSYPENASFPYLAMKSSVWFWNFRNLSKLADGSMLGFHRLVKKLNGAKMNGLTDRIKRWTFISQVLHCSAITDGVGEDCNSGKGSCVVESTCKTKIIPKCTGKYCCSDDEPKTVICCQKGLECQNRGIAEFYQCANTHFKCEASDYLLDYGFRFSNRFSVYYSMFDQQGKNWINAVLESLMKRVTDIFDLSLSCDDLKSHIFPSHSHCYDDSADGFCNILNVKNILGFLQVFEFKDYLGDDADLVIEQIVQTTKSCICRTTNIRGIEDIVSSINKQKFKDIIMTAETGITTEAERLAKNADCRFYTLFEQRFPCSSVRPHSHVDDFELPLCEIYDEHLDLYDDEGQWVLSARRCVMNELLSVYKSASINCTKMLGFIFKIREFCYKKGRFGEFEAKTANQCAMSRILSVNNRLSPYYYRVMTVYGIQLKYLRCQFHGKAINKYKMIKSTEGVWIKTRV